MSQLEIRPTEEEGTFILSGSIGVNTDLSCILKKSPSHLIFRFIGIEEITSMGIKKWVEGIRKLQQEDKTIEYQDCPEIFIEQCNLVSEIVQEVTVRSFEVTFVCEDCDIEESKMLKKEELDLENLPPLILCPSCQEEMITEEEDVFRFITTIF